MTNFRRTILLCALLTATALAGCGAGKAVTETGGLFDKYACLSRDFRGEPACDPKV